MALSEVVLSELFISNSEKCQIFLQYLQGQILLSPIISYLLQMWVRSRATGNMATLYRMTC